jgi:hypothetical protein
MLLTNQKIKRMPIKFNVVQKKNLQDVTAAPKWYASAVLLERMAIELNKVGIA